MDKLEIHRKGVGMDNKDMMQVPYIVYEQAEVRHERTVKRLIIALIITVILMFTSNGLWLWYESQFEYAYDEELIMQETTDGGNVNYIGNDGDINNGETDNQESNIQKD